MNKNVAPEELHLELFKEDPIESYEVQGDTVVRRVKDRNGVAHETSLLIQRTEGGQDAASRYDAAWLRLTEAPPSPEVGREIRVVDLFCGCGGMSLGIQEAGHALERPVAHVFANDMESTFLDVYKNNFSPLFDSSASLEELIDRDLDEKLSSTERRMKKKVGDLTILVGGPPCQGHSDLNNYTRRADPKNNLYLRMARAAQVLLPEHIIIENVPGVRHDKSRVMQRTIEAIARLGYTVDIADVNAHHIGVAQRRQRTFVIASRVASIHSGSLSAHLRSFVTPERSVGWACSDLLDHAGSSPFDGYSKLSAESQRRVDWLFDNDEYDLPDRFRPDCHSTKEHTYKSVYGRLYWDRPAWTITTGFPVMGQGRFLHPLQRRGLTVHEAARLQFFPDFFRFGSQSRKDYAKMIGNAVPPKMAYVVALHLLR